MNFYYQNILDFQNELKDYAKNIFKTFGNIIEINQDFISAILKADNCIESSTAVGFILEEFIVSKLEMFTHCDDSTKYKIDRFVGVTARESFDCYSINENGCKFMVNVKAEKKGRANDAVAAIGQLHRNYCLEEPEQEKSFILFKVLYSIGEATEDSENKRAKPRHIHIDGLESYCLEEIDFRKGHQQDNRSWSENKIDTKNNGRLKISSAFRKEHQVLIEEISYKNTFDMLNNLVENNK